MKEQLLLLAFLFIAIFLPFSCNHEEEKFVEPLPKEKPTRELVSPSGSLQAYVWESDSLIIVGSWRSGIAILKKPL